MAVHVNTVLANNTGPIFYFLIPIYICMYLLSAFYALLKHSAFYNVLTIATVHANYILSMIYILCTCIMCISYMFVMCLYFICIDNSKVH